MTRSIRLLPFPRGLEVYECSRTVPSPWRSWRLCYGPGERVDVDLFGLLLPSHDGLVVGFCGILSCGV